MITDEINKLALDYDAFREMAAEAEKQKKSLSTKIKTLLKEMGVKNLDTALAELGVNVVASNVIDIELLKELFPEIVQKVTKVRVTERLDVRIKR